MRIVGLLIATALVASPLANAQEACPTPEVLAGAAITFDDLYGQINVLAVEKGEFETTAQFEARRNAIQLPSSALVQIHVDPEWFEYDADHERFILKAERFEFFSLPFRYDPKADKTVYGLLSRGKPVLLPAYSETITEGVRLAQNAYGVQFTIAQERLNYALIFDRPPRDDYSADFDTLFSENDDMGATDYKIRLKIPAPLASAAALKGEMAAVAYITPKAPFAQSFQDFRGATTTSRRELTTVTHVLHADIQCFGVRDGGGNILAHWATR